VAEAEWAAPFTDPLAFLDEHETTQQNEGSNLMLMQDSLTGYLHEVPEVGEADPYGEMPYDGFGNPVGFFGRRRRRRRVSEPTPQAAPPAPTPPEGGPGAEMGPEGGEQMPGDDEMGQVAYDGLGNPVGFFNPFKAVGQAIRGVGSLVTSPFRALQSVGRATGLPVPGAALPFAAGLLPFLAQRLAAQRRAIQQYRVAGRPVPPALAQSFRNILAQVQRARMRGRRGLPLGWIRPPLPYTGLGPRRLYMRCAVWPGPRGLVPRYAAQMKAAAIQQAAQMAAQRAAAMGRHRRRHRRRR